MSTKAKRHIHKYRKINLAFQKVWACALPDCAHHMPKHMEEMVEGKFSLCWQCNEQMVLGPDNMKMDMPICLDCQNGTVKPKVEIVDSEETIKQRLAELMDGKL